MAMQMETRRAGEQEAVRRYRRMDFQKADIGERPGDIKHRRLRYGQPRRNDDRRDDEQEPFKERERGDVGGARPTRPGSAVSTRR